MNKIAGRRVVETGFQKKLIEKNRLLEDFYVVEKIFFTNTKGQPVERWSCYAEDASDHLSTG